MPVFEVNITGCSLNRFIHQKNPWHILCGFTACMLQVKMWIWMRIVPIQIGMIRVQATQLFPDSASRGDFFIIQCGFLLKTLQCRFCTSEATWKKLCVNVPQGFIMLRCKLETRIILISVMIHYYGRKWL